MVGRRESVSPEKDQISSLLEEITQMKAYIRDLKIEYFTKLSIMEKSYLEKIEIISQDNKLLRLRLEESYEDETSSNFAGFPNHAASTSRQSNEKLNSDNIADYSQSQEQHVSSQPMEEDEEFPAIQSGIKEKKSHSSSKRKFSNVTESSRQAPIPKKSILPPAIIVTKLNVSSFTRHMREKFFLI